MVGVIGMSFFGIAFAYHASQFMPQDGLWHNKDFIFILVELLFISLFGGLFSVPLYTIMQRYSDVESRSRVIAANNILNAFFMVLGAVMTIVLLKQNIQMPTIFFIAVSCLGVVGGVIAVVLTKWLKVS